MVLEAATSNNSKLSEQQSERNLEESIGKVIRKKEEIKERMKNLVKSPRGAMHRFPRNGLNIVYRATNPRTNRRFCQKPKVPSPALNNESILVKILG